MHCDIKFCPLFNTAWLVHGGSKSSFEQFLMTKYELRKSTVVDYFHHTLEDMKISLKDENHKGLTPSHWVFCHILYGFAKAGSLAGWLFARVLFWDYFPSCSWWKCTRRKICSTMEQKQAAFGHSCAHCMCTVVCSGKKINKPAIRKERRNHI